MTPERLEELNAKCVAWMMKSLKDEGYTEEEIYEGGRKLAEENARIQAAVDAEDYELYAQLTGKDPNDRYTKICWQQKMWLKQRRDELDREKSENGD